MALMHDRPLFTTAYRGGLGSFTPNSGSAYFYGTFEQRSLHEAEWESGALGVTFIRIEEQGLHSIGVGDGARTVGLRDLDALKTFVRGFGCQAIYLDITGLSHHVWAPLLRAAWEASLDISCVYVEPQDYRFSALPREGQIFDLSERIEGIAPLPGFTSLREASEENTRFVPLLGFEGTRFMYVME